MTTTWRNWGNTESANPVERARPRSADEVVALVGSARERGLRVKPLGTGHSFSGIAVAPGIQVDTSGLGGVLSVGGVHPAGGVLSDGSVLSDGAEVRVGAGMSLHALSAALEPLGLALENMGDIDVQTVAGATSTGTHGSGSRFGGLATRITGATLVTGTGELMTVNSRENAELLPAVSLGLGALGVLLDLTIRCVPAFGLHVVERPEALEPVLEGWEQRVAEADHFEFYWFPHTNVAMAKTSTRLPADAPIRPLGAMQRWFDDSFMANTVFAGSIAFQRAFPRTTPAMNRFSTHHWSNREFSDLASRAFATERRARFREMEYAVPFADMPGILREIDALITRRGWTVSFPIEVRAAAADDLWMSTASGRATGYLAIHRYVREDPTEYFRAVEEIMIEHGGRPHWGKMNWRTAESLATVYPRFGDFLAVRDRLDPERVFTNDYLDRVLGK